METPSMTREKGIYNDIKWVNNNAIGKDNATNKDEANANDIDIDEDEINTTSLEK